MGTQIGREVKLFSDDMLLYLEDPKDATKKLLELTNQFGKAIGYKINTQKFVAYLHTKKKKNQKEKFKKEVHYYCIKKNKIPRNKHTCGDERPILQKL